VRPALLLRLEAVVVLLACIIVYATQHYSWVLFAVLFLAPDLVIFAYMAGVKVGAIAYNAVHTYITPAIVLVLGMTTNPRWLIPCAVIWSAHIAIDRALGFGLKYPTTFKDTHLQRL
jgi:Domain of unknown function (DUF4260)